MHKYKIHPDIGKKKMPFFKQEVTQGLTSEPFIIVDTDALPLLKILFEIFHNSWEQRLLFSFLGWIDFA